MIPMLLCNIGETKIIRKIGGSPEVRRHLEELGFTVGTEVTLVAQAAGNLIVKVRETRVAIGKELAGRIMV